MKAKNNQTEKIKIVFGFTFALFTAFVGGIGIFKLLGQNAESLIKESMLLHFDAVLPSSDKAAFLWYRTLRLNICELACVFSVLLFSFSFINRFVSYAVLLFTGARFGLFASALRSLGLSRAGLGNSLCFWLIKGLMVILIYNYTCKMASQALNSRHYSAENGRVLMKKRTLASMLALTLYTISALILLGGAYCLFLYAF